MSGRGSSLGPGALIDCRDFGIGSGKMAAPGLTGV